MPASSRQETHILYKELQLDSFPLKPDSPELHDPTSVQVRDAEAKLATLATAVGPLVGSSVQVLLN